MKSPIREITAILLGTHMRLMDTAASRKMLYYWLTISGANENGKVTGAKTVTSGNNSQTHVKSVQIQSKISLIIKDCFG